MRGVGRPNLERNPTLMPEEPEEEGFTFRDRRRTQIEETPAAPAPPPVVEAPPVAQTAAPMVEEPYDAPELLGPDGMPAEGDYTLPDVRDLLTEYLLVLRDVSVLRLGLAPNPGTGQMEQDLPQAKIAIDTMVFLAGQIEPFLRPEETLPLKSMLGDLQLAYVRQSGG